MQKLSYIVLFFCLIYSWNGFSGDIELPTYVRLEIKKTIYEYNPNQQNNIFGDGYYGKVVEVSGTSMKKFVDNFNELQNYNRWTNGSLIKYKLHLKIIENIEKYIKNTLGDQELEKLDNEIHLNELKKNPNIYHKINYKENSNGHISDAEIWILIPAKNIICFLAYHT